MKIGIISFKVESRTYKFKKPLRLELEYAEIREDKDSEDVDSGVCLTNKELNLSACEKFWGDCLGIIREELAMLWEGYALATRLSNMKKFSENSIRNGTAGADGYSSFTP